MNTPKHSRTISVENWHILATEGIDIPIPVFLSGDSMRPLIRKGLDKVTVVPLRRPVKPGDIVLFADVNGRYVVHRVWKQWGDQVFTIGDHCADPDVPLMKSMVWGLVVKVQRGGWKLPLDNPVARGFGKLWMALLPLRRWYYRMKNRGNAHGT